MLNGFLLDFSVLIPVAKKTMWERLTAPEDVFSKLQRENMAIIESYGAALMEVVCRDACDGHEIGRVKYHCVELLLNIVYLRKYILSQLLKCMLLCIILSVLMCYDL